MVISCYIDNKGNVLSISGGKKKQILKKWIGYLTPYLNKNGKIRVAGKLQRSKLS